LNSEAAEPLRLAALGALAPFDSPRLADDLLAAYPGATPAVQARIRDVLLARATWGGAFLAAVDRGEIPAADATLDQIRAVALHGNAEFDALVRKWWGNVTGGTPEEKLAEIRRLSNDLRAAPGDPAAGRDLFTKHCANCHQLFGEGKKVGPELTTANRQDQNYLLASLVDPSAVVRKEYLSFNVRTTAGQIFTGLIVDQTPAGVTLLDAKNQRMEIARDEIEELAEATVSLMPESLYKEFKPQALRDLFGYLQGPAPAGAEPAPTK
jgi:putative heme-binding domain-containing protein